MREPVAESNRFLARRGYRSLGIEYVWGLPRGGFENISEEARRVRLDNAHTVPKLFGMPPPRPMACEDLARMRRRSWFSGGTETLPYFEAVAKGSLPACPMRLWRRFPMPGTERRGMPGTSSARRRGHSSAKQTVRNEGPVTHGGSNSRARKQRLDCFAGPLFPGEFRGSESCNQECVGDTPLAGPRLA